MHAFLVSAAAFIVLIGVMVVVHEAGHFVMAKLCGVRVEAFSFGFGPRLFGFKYGDTDYKVCLLPLGGFVKMTGESPEQNLEAPGAAAADLSEDPGAFTSHPRWQRILIGLAGPMANFALTLVLMTIYYAWINEVPASVMKTTTMEWVTPGSAAAVAGFEPRDVITRFDNVTNPNWDIVYDHALVNANQVVPVTVEREGRPIQLSLHIPSSAKSANFDFSDTGISPQYREGPIGVAEIQPDTPAARAGLLAGDQIESVDGHAFHYVSTLLAYMQWAQGKPMTLEVLRNGATVQIHVTPTKLDTKWKLGFAAAGIPIREQPMSLPAAFSSSVGFFENNSLLVGEVLQRLFTHKISVTQMMGPVGIAQAAGEAAEMDGWYPKFGLAAQISLQLGILNLFPFPILDGGMILLLLIESGLRHNISLAVKERIYTAAFVVIVAFIAFTVFNDVSKLSLFTHVKP
ncbi:Peptidase, M50 family [Candidatus Sulfotelmatomonas gaucii]|uniref:Zinc metalloprotease n=1 Tax=Candidatus Sulfuritelmatomonas gaucii TaxID=2043161 RepID=A0A2N9LCA3_9BACT|nr:Peptidase, M50 family [Candidatus Sulfotelmatomonas gaucii]